MEMLRQPLHQSLVANKEELSASEQKARADREGNPEGNRHERRIAARRARQLLKQ